MHGALWITSVADSSPLSMVLVSQARVEFTRPQFVTSPRLERMDTHARELDLHTTVIDTIVLPDTLKWPVFTRMVPLADFSVLTCVHAVHMKYVGCGGEVYLNGKMISNYEHSPTIHK